eukprot:scaffold2357_cov108-Cylindrotheca_fusiformis.AAC.2
MSTKVIHTSLGRNSTHCSETAPVAGLWIWNAGHSDVITSESEDDSDWGKHQSVHMISTGHATLQDVSEVYEDEMDSEEECSFHSQREDLPNHDAGSVDTCNRSVDTFAYDDDIVAMFDDATYVDEVIEAMSGVAKHQGHGETFEGQQSKIAIAIASELCSRASDDSVSLAESEVLDPAQDNSLPDHDLKTKPPPPPPDYDSTTELNSDSDFMYSPASMSNYVTRLARSPKVSLQPGRSTSNGSQREQLTIAEESESDRGSGAKHPEDLSGTPYVALQVRDTPTEDAVEDEDDSVASSIASIQEDPAQDRFQDVDTEGEEDCSKGYMEITIEGSVSHSAGRVGINIDDEEPPEDINDTGRASGDTDINDTGRTLATIREEATKELISLLLKLKSDFLEGVRKGEDHGTITLNEQFSQHQVGCLGDANNDRSWRSAASAETGSAFSLVIRPGLTRQISGLTAQSFTESQKKPDVINITGTARSNGSSVSIEWKKVVPKPRMNPARSRSGKQFRKSKSQKGNEQPLSSKSLHLPAEDEDVAVVKTKSQRKSSGRDSTFKKKSNKKSSKKGKKSRKVSRRKSCSNETKNPHNFIRSNPQTPWAKVEAKGKIKKRRSRPWKSSSNAGAKSSSVRKRHSRSASAPEFMGYFPSVKRESKLQDTSDQLEGSPDLQHLCPPRHGSAKSRLSESDKTEATCTSDSTVTVTNLTQGQDIQTIQKQHSKRILDLVQDERGRSTRGQSIRSSNDTGPEKVNSKMRKAVGVQQNPASELKQETHISAKKQEESKNRREKLRRPLSGVLRDSQRKLKDALTPRRRRGSA